MPDDNQSSQNQKPPNFFPQDDNTSVIPPKELQEEDKKVPEEPVATQTSDTPPSNPPPVSPQPKKRWGKGALIGSIAALMVLFVGLVAGLILVPRQQEIREKAQVETTPTPTPTPTSTPSVTGPTCEEVKILRGGTEIQKSDIKLNDTIVFRAFAAIDTQVNKFKFTLTKGGVAQTPVEVSTVLVGNQYQADYQITISEAASYSVKVEPVVP